MAKQHAILSASGAHRWLECTPSAQLEQQFPPSTSEYAEEGTAAHELAELTAHYFLGEISETEFEAKRDELAKGPYYGDSETMFPGKNEDGELVFISIYHDRIIQETYQANDWIRCNTYWRDGTREETYKK